MQQRNLPLVVDGARMPVYFALEHERILALWPIVLIASGAVVVGTLVGAFLLHRIRENTFKRIVSILVLALGVFMLFRPNHG